MYMYTCKYIYMYICMCMCIYKYVPDTVGTLEATRTPITNAANEHLIYDAYTYSYT